MKVWHVSVCDDKDFHWTVEAFATRRQAYNFKRQLENTLEGLEGKSYTVYIHNTLDEVE